MKYYHVKLIRVSRKYDYFLSHLGRVTQICVGDRTIIGSDNGLSPGRRQAIIWTNAGILLIGPLGTNFSEIQIGIQTFSYKKMHLKMSSVKWRPLCLGLNVLKTYICAPLLFYYLHLVAMGYVIKCNRYGVHTPTVSGSLCVFKSSNKF